MLKTILFVLLLVAGGAMAEDEKNSDKYVNDCDSYGQLAYTTTYLRHHAVTFEDGVKRFMTRDEFIERFKTYMKKSEIDQGETDRLLKEMLEVWDTEMSDDPVDLYTENRAKCEKSGRK